MGQIPPKFQLENPEAEEKESSDQRERKSRVSTRTIAKKGRPIDRVRRVLFDQARESQKG